MSSVNTEIKAEIDANGPQENQGGHNHSMGGRGGGRGGGRRFGGPGGRQRDDMRGGMRQEVSESGMLGDLLLVKFATLCNKGCLLTPPPHFVIRLRIHHMLNRLRQGIVMVRIHICSKREVSV